MKTIAQSAVITPAIIGLALLAASKLKVSLV